MVDSFLAVVLGFSTILFGLTALYFYRNANNKNKQSEFEEFSKKLNESNKEEIDKTWKPYKEQLQRDLDILKTSIEQQKAIAIKNSERFNAKIEDLLNATSGMQEDAQNLTKALKGDTKQQGDWGEQILKKALEDAGLVEGLEYELQPSYKSKDGSQLRPDAVIKLSDGRNIIIDENVSINGNIDLRNRENGKIIISKDVTIDTNSRFVAANNATLNIGKGCKLGSYLIFNCGEDITVGEDCIFGGFCYFQSSNHGIKKDELIKYQDHTYGKIIIGKGAWFGARVTVLPGVTIGEGSVIGANSVVTKDIPSNSIAVGIPAKVISYRN